MAQGCILRHLVETLAPSQVDAFEKHVQNHHKKSSAQPFSERPQRLKILRAFLRVRPLRATRPQLSSPGLGFLNADCRCICGKSFEDSSGFQDSSLTSPTAFCLLPSTRTDFYMRPWSLSLPRQSLTDKESALLFVLVLSCLMLHASHVEPGKNSELRLHVEQKMIKTCYH